MVILSAAPVFAAPTGQNVVIGYYFLSPEQINRYAEDDPKTIPFPISRITPAKAKQLTHINFAFVDIDKNGEVAWDAKVDPKKAKEVVARLAALRVHNPKLRIMYSVGGWYYSQDQGPSVQHYRTAVATAAAREKLAKSLVRFMKDWDFDGIDVDWEYPRAEDAAPFADMLKVTRDLLNKENALRRERPYQLTIAGAGGAFFLSRYYHQLPRIVESLDYLNLMTYDLAGPWERTTNHHAALFGDPAGPKFYNALREAKDDLVWEEKVKRHPSPFALTVDAAVMQHLIGGVPASKLVVGVPFYGRAFKGVTGDRGQYSGHSTAGGDPYVGDATWLVGCPRAAAEKEPRVASYAEIKEMLAGNHGYVRYFNDKAKSPWLHNAKHGLFVTYEDGESILCKAKYIKAEKLGGAMFWHLGQDDADGTLLAALHRGLNDKDYDDAKLSLGDGLRYEGKGPLQLSFMEAEAWDAAKTYGQGRVVGYMGFVWRANYFQSAGTRPSFQAGWAMIGQWKPAKQ
jgi:chitinase